MFWSQLEAKIISCINFYWAEARRKFVRGAVGVVLFIIMFITRGQAYIVTFELNPSL